ncbi:hypothetical protein DSECCO2_598690 [anaerobic digester metagenome]
MGEVAGLGVEDDFLSGFLAPVEPIQEFFRDDALAVVREDDRVELVDPGVNGFGQLREFEAVEGPVRFPVHAQHLLVGGDDASLEGSFPELRRDEAALDPEFRADFAQVAAIGVLAAQADEGRLAAQGGDVLRHVARAADLEALVRDLDDGYRRFGRDAFDDPFLVLVEHDVADDQHAGADHAGCVEGQIHACSSPAMRSRRAAIRSRSSLLA